MKEELISAGLTLVGAVLVALLTWWLTERSRDKADTAKDRAVADALLATQADAVVLAVVSLQASATTNRTLWDGPAERARTFLLASLAAVGGYARHGDNVPEWRRFFSAFGEVSTILAQDRIAAKQATAGMTAEVSRLAAATVPLMRHPNAAIRDATELVIARATEGGGRNTSDLEAAMRQFGQAVRAVLPTWTSAP